jgi:hypothetical protein
MSRHVRPQDLKPSPLSRRLVRRLREAGFSLPLDDDRYALQGGAAGRNQKAAGCWAWELFSKQRNRKRDEWRPMGIGSCDPASSLRRDTVVTSFTNHGDCEVCFEQPRNHKP